MKLEEMTFGATIRSLRKQNHMTQAMLADKLGITDKAVSKWERDISYPDITLFPRLADVMGVSVEDLLVKAEVEEITPRLAQIFQMSHDIRTPLNIILGSTDLAVRYCDDRERLLRYLQNIRFSGEYLLAVIDHLMEVAGREEGESPAQGRPVPSEEWKPVRDIALNQMPASADYDFSGRRVLLVEDIEVNREIAFEILNETGIEVEFAEDGQIAVDKIAHSEPGYYDLVLMDIQMPNMNGLEATRRIRAMADSRKASIPIIAMTANVYESDRREAFDAGMDDFTGKPIMVDRLFETMKKYL